MKIGVVSSEYPPFHGGGIGTYSANLSRFLAEAGHDVYVIANSWSGDADLRPVQPPAKVGPANLHVVQLDVLSKDYSPRPPHDGEEDFLGQVCRRWDSSLYWSLNAADALERIHKQVGLEIVEFPECFAEAYIALRRRRLDPSALNLPITLTLHSPIHEVTEHNRYSKHQAWFQRRNMMEEYCIRRADRLSCPSNLLATQLQQRLGLDPAHAAIDVIRNPMDFGSLPAVWASEREHPTLLYVGRIEQRKGCKYLIQAAVQVMEEIPHLRVRLIGKDCDAGETDGSMRDHLLTFIPERLRPNFVFEGLLPRDQVIRAYREAMACVFPAPWDNFPYACCEAMASAACVIASTGTGMAEMIEPERSGLLFPTADVGALGAAIRRAISDPLLRQRLRDNAARRIHALTDPDVVVPQKLIHYERAIEDYRRNRPAPSRPRQERGRIAVFVNGEGPLASITVKSVQQAAGQAGLVAELRSEPNNNAPERNGPRPTRALEDWVRSCSVSHPQFLLKLEAGTVVGSEYFVRTVSALDDRAVGWATSWAKPAVGQPALPYAGFDFSLPLELMYFHPIPVALIRWQAFAEVGGWNFDLPDGWREWDLWLALHQAGWQGIVAPWWLAEYCPQSMPGLEHPLNLKTHELLLERVVARNRAIITVHATELWMNLCTNPLWSSPSARLPRQHGLETNIPQPPNETLVEEPRATRRWGIFDLLRRMLVRKSK